jgi:hypothetical protein
MDVVVCVGFGVKVTRTACGGGGGRGGEDSMKRASHCPGLLHAMLLAVDHRTLFLTCGCAFCSPAFFGCTNFVCSARRPRGPLAGPGCAHCTSLPTHSRSST